MITFDGFAPYENFQARAAIQGDNQYGLEPKHWRFCQELVIDDNATQAAIRAGYSPKGAKQQAARLLTNVDLQRAVADLRAERARRLEVSADRVLKELAALAFSDPLLRLKS